jgi:hypothetical protein
MTANPLIPKYFLSVMQNSKAGKRTASQVAMMARGQVGPGPIEGRAACARLSFAAVVFVRCIANRRRWA